MKYIIIAWKKGTSPKRGNKQVDNIDDAIKLAKAVASHYHCFTRIERVQA